jgi:hypothetical protein
MEIRRSEVYIYVMAGAGLYVSKQTRSLGIVRILPYRLGSSM